MWQQHYTPVAGSLGLSALVAAIPLFVLLILLGVARRPAWVAALSGLGAATLVALLVYGMPVSMLLSAIAYGGAFGLLPICWVIFWAIALYRLTVETGSFETLKDSIGGITNDRRLQALLIAFAFGAFIEGAAGFGAPVAVASAMLAGLGFPPFYAAGICLLANTAPVAYGSIGTPVITLAGITGLPLRDLSAMVGRICAPVSVFVPAYLILVVGGFRAMKGVLPAVATCGISFAVMQFLVSNYMGPQLTDIIASLTAIGSLLLLFRFWKPKDTFTLEGDRGTNVPRHWEPRAVVRAWLPYFLLVVFVALWGQDWVKKPLDAATWKLDWPGLHNAIERVPPVVTQASPYAATFTLNTLTASGTACLFAVLASALLLRIRPAQLGRVIAATGRQLALSVLTITSVLALAFLMNYCGATATLGLAFAATGSLFPFFSGLLGWLGVFLTGSDTSANALFGSLQVVTAGRLGLDPVLMAAANSSGGVMGKMISLQNIAVAVAATGLASSDEARLFRFTLKHSIILATVVSLIVVLYSLNR
jgi:L-lactate transport